MFVQGTAGRSHPPARVTFGTELQARGTDSLKWTTASELPADHSQEMPSPKKSRVAGSSRFSMVHLPGQEHTWSPKRGGVYRPSVKVNPTGAHGKVTASTSESRDTSYFAIAAKGVETRSSFSRLHVERARCWQLGSATYCKATFSPRPHSLSLEKWFG